MKGVSSHRNGQQLAAWILSVCAILILLVACTVVVVSVAAFCYSDKGIYGVVAGFGSMVASVGFVMYEFGRILSGSSSVSGRIDLVFWLTGTRLITLISFASFVALVPGFFLAVNTGVFSPALRAALGYLISGVTYCVLKRRLEQLVRMSKESKA